jgi:hypothetical protein
MRVPQIASPSFFSRLADRGAAFVQFDDHGWVSRIAGTALITRRSRHRRDSNLAIGQIERDIRLGTLLRLTLMTGLGE